MFLIIFACFLSTLNAGFHSHSVDIESKNQNREFIGLLLFIFRNSTKAFLVLL